jgi:hypothetical protein
VKRVDKAYRWVRRWILVIAAASLASTLIPGAKDLAWSFLLGLLLGGLNFHLLLSGLRRALRLHPGTAHGSFQVASFFRLIVVGGLLLWAAKQGPQLLAWPVLVGFFMPEILFFIELYGRTKEESL